MNTSIFAASTVDLRHTANTSPTPLRDHAQLAHMIDVLSRHETHHLHLQHAGSQKINYALMQALSERLTTARCPHTLRECEFIYFDVSRYLLAVATQKEYEHISHEMNKLTEKCRAENKRILFAIDQTECRTHENGTAAIEHLRNTLAFLLSDDQWRFIIFTENKASSPFISIKHYFSVMTLNELTANESIALLKAARPVLEQFHPVLIAEDAFTSAYSFATHYLPGKSHVDKAYELLDSAAARASETGSTDTAENKPLVTSHLLAQLISSWTHIPLSHLQSNSFQSSKFFETLSKQIAGQDAALRLIAQRLQSACLKLNERPGSLCTFLFAGATDTGKATTAYAMAEHLFGHKQALLHVNLSKSQTTSLSNIKILSASPDTQPDFLLSAIRRTPYAIVLLEHIDQLPSDVFDIFNDILTQGYVRDENGDHYDFRHAIFIMTTEAGADVIEQLTHPKHKSDAIHNLELMQILNAPLNETSAPAHQTLSSQELSDRILPELAPHLTMTLRHSAHIVPFLPLDHAAIEKIIRAKIRQLARQLDMKFKIELQVAPEAVQFLAHEALWRNPKTKSLESLLEQTLFSCVTHELLLNADNHQRSKRLLIQLNDMGQLLRCEFMTAQKTELWATSNA